MKIKFGIGRKCINPEVPISLAGYFNKRMWDKVLDDIEVRVAVFKGDEGEFAFVHFDILSISYPFYCDVLSALQSKYPQFKEENVLISAIHTHTAPDINNCPTSAEYRKFAAGCAADALQTAMENMEDGEVYTAMAQDARFQFNRRYWMKDGSVLTNPGKLNPEIDRPEGAIDPQIPIIAIKNSEGIKLLMASIVNHTDTIGGCGVSADWSGFMRRELEPEMAPGAMVMSLIGCAGNINHFDVTTDMDQTCYAEPERIGKGYAETIRKVWNDLTPVKDGKFGFDSAISVSAPREISPEEVRDAQAVMDKYPDVDINAGGDLTSEDLAKKTPVVLKFFAEKLLAIANSTFNPTFRLSLLKFGDDVVIASLPSEPFVEIGLNLRKSIFNGKHCLVCSHGNYNGGGHFIGGYIPNSWNYGRGGYETTPRSSGYSERTADVLLESWRKLAAAQER
ncbi:MAG: hypothetical protein IKA22_07400 [Lentisphaeria bacterium]|nr:hypothetical protein [Lentisphaeria bacterium]